MDQRRTAMQVADEAHERIERLNTWAAALHRRLWVVEQRLGIQPLTTELADDARLAELEAASEQLPG